MSWEFLIKTENKKLLGFAISKMCKTEFDILVMDIFLSTSINHFKDQVTEW